MDSDSDMEPEDDDFLPDGDDFVIENSGEAMLDEPVFVRFYQKNFGRCLFTKLSPFSAWPLFCYHDNSKFNYTKILECIC